MSRSDIRKGKMLLASAEATESLGVSLGLALGNAGVVTFLEGDLGAGKTTLARGWLRALGVTGPIRSPTYTLVEPYDVGGRRWLHLDLYRLNDPLELEQLGLPDSPPELGGWLIEWPQRGGGRDGGFLPVPQLELLLGHGHDERWLEWQFVPSLAKQLEAILVDHPKIK